MTIDFRWQWVLDHVQLLSSLTGQHVVLAFVPVVLGLVISVPLGVLCSRFPRIYPPVLATASALYALPSIALFVFLLDYTGLTDWTVIIPLTLYSLSVLVRNVVDGMRSVSDSVRQAATAMGFGRLRRLVQVELPIAVPVIFAGVRVATVSSVSLVSIGALIGSGGLGQLFTDGLQRDFATPIIVGIVMSVALAILADSAIVLTQRLLTPWARRTTRAVGG